MIDKILKLWYSILMRKMFASEKDDEHQGFIYPTDAEKRGWVINYPSGNGSKLSGIF